MALDGLLDDREPEPRAGQGTSRSGPVEAVEDVRQVGLGDPGPVVAHGQPPVGEPDLDGAAGRAPLDRVVENVVDARARAAIGPRRTGRARSRLSKLQLRRPVLRPLDRCRHELVERERLAGIDRAAVAGGLDEIADQRREPLHRPDGCAEHALPLFDGQVRPRQQLDVRAVRGQRRPQLMRGVGDQLLLRLLGLLEGREHRIEVGREAGELVAAADRDPLVEVPRRAHLAHRPGERTHGAQHGIRGQPSEQGRRERPTERQRRAAASGRCAIVAFASVSGRAVRTSPSLEDARRIVYSAIATPR